MTEGMFVLEDQIAVTTQWKSTGQAILSGVWLCFDLRNDEDLAAVGCYSKTPRTIWLMLVADRW